MRISYVIKRPIITEKTTVLAESQNEYVFDVHMRATKGLISKEVKKLYGVDAMDVRTMIMPGKKRRIPKTRRFMKTKGWKKALVKIVNGQKIDLAGK